MKKLTSKTMTSLTLACALFGSLGMTAMAAPSVELSSDSKIGFDGTSTLHPFHAYTSNLKLKGVLGGEKGGKDWARRVILTALDFSFPIKTLKSGDGLLDSNLYKCIDTDKHPNVQFVSQSCKMKISDAGDVEVTAEGTLEMNGAAREILVKAEGKLEGNRFRLKGKKQLSLVEYGIKPPVLMMGAIRVGDEITVQFDLVGQALLD